FRKNFLCFSRCKYRNYVCLFAKKYIHVNMPMTIGGSSQNSVGLSYVNDINKSEYDKFRCDMDQLKNIIILPQNVICFICQAL
ncbi:hypothetical protein AK964_21650, partial [Clostridium butyricum]